jgi:4-amino-4-deoxy-L-arabinose transferase-like glycosyltransferase
MDKIRYYWQEKPLTLILFLGILIRFVAVIFSRGYGMHDDHFLVIETAQSWLDGADYNNWFKERDVRDAPTILNFAYAGIHYLLFAFLEAIGIFSPQWKMLLVRMIHAAFSLLTIVYGYRIAEKISNRETAKVTGIILALLWFMPFFSVRNLVEMVCIPFIMWAFWIIIKNIEEKGKYRAFLLAGILLGISFSIRFQTMLFPVGIGFVLLFRKQFKEILLLGTGILIPFIIMHGIPDWIIWGEPFIEVKTYILHNVEHRYDYSNSPWYTYILVLIGVLIVPVSFFMLFGLFAAWKKNIILFLPIIIFIIFHSYFPNKQERFILPVIPLLITAGLAGWYRYINDSHFWLRNKQLHKACWIIFWILNSLLLIFFSTMYSKKARVESMIYLSKFENVRVILLEDTNKDNASMAPLFYMGQWPEVFQVTKKHTMSDLPVDSITGKPVSPDFVLFYGKQQLHQRVLETEKVYPGMEYATTIQPGMIDKVLHWLNPVNANESIYIYRNR